MINYQLFPRFQGIVPEIQAVIDCFISVDNKIDSTKNNLSSNQVLKVLEKSLELIGYSVETSS